jgi:hypothetical protein
MCASTSPTKVRQPDLGEETQEGDAQYDMRDHQGDMNSAVFLATTEAVRRCERGGHPENATAMAEDSAQPQAAPEGRDELGIAADGVEPAQRPAVGRKR